MQNTQPNLQNIRQIISEYHWLDLAESGAIAASAFGTFAGALSSQVVYAAAPLTIALALNLVNRYRLDENTEQYTKAAISDVRNVVESLYTSLPEDSSPEMDFPSLQKSIAHLQKVTERLENKALTEDDWQMVNVRFLTLQESLERLTASIGNVPVQTNFPGQAATTVIQGEKGDQPVNSSLELIDSNYLALEQRISQLEEKNKAIVKPYLQRLTHSLQQIKQSQSLGKVRQKIKEISEDIQQRNVVQEEVNQLTEQLQQIAAQQDQLNQQFLEHPATDQPDLTNLETAIAQISEELNETKTETSQRFEGIVETINPLEIQITQLQQLTKNLQAALENITDNLDHFADVEVVENIENILNQVSAELAELQDKISEFSLPFNPETIEQQLQELTVLVHQKSTEPSQFLTKKDIAPLVAAVKKLHKRK
jgi:DNA repair exonuclease SbcCD ATPase subunit